MDSGSIIHDPVQSFLLCRDKAEFVAVEDSSDGHFIIEILSVLSFKST